MAKQRKQSRFAKISSWVGLIGGIVGILAIIPYAIDFFGWTKSLKYVELNASFPNEKWRETSEKDFKWLSGSWDIPKLRGFTTNFKIEKGKLFRQNIGHRSNDPYGNFTTEWTLTEVHISDNKILRLSYPKEPKWSLTFLRKDDDCSCHENERYIADDGSVKSSDGRQMFNISHTKFSEDGVIYECK